jgi:putative intracellular protease/amidase
MALEKNNIALFFLLDGYADWETGYVSAKLHNLGYMVRTISLTLSAVRSQGNFLTSIDDSLDTFQDYQNLAVLLLIGGTGWGDQHLIKGYGRERYDAHGSKRIKACIDHSISIPSVVVAAICDGATFMADNGYLDTIPHTGNSLEHLREKAPGYKGKEFFQEKQAVSSHSIITANGTAPLEFSREILISLHALGNKENIHKWYLSNKKGSFPL